MHHYNPLDSSKINAKNMSGAKNLCVKESKKERERFLKVSTSR
jgi:hypothetical protein